MADDQEPEIDGPRVFGDPLDKARPLLTAWIASATSVAVWPEDRVDLHWPDGRTVSIADAPLAERLRECGR